MTDFRELCAELVELEDFEPGDYDNWLEKRRVAIKRAKAALAQPEPEGATDEELLQIAAATIDPYESCGIAIGEYEAETECAVEVYGSELIAFARAVLARWGRPAIEPVPVSERLPGPEDTTDRNECWYWHPGKECWEMVPKVTGTVDEWSHWLPHHALPLPTP